MSKFKIGDPVRVINPRTTYFDAVGTITSTTTDVTLPPLIVDGIASHPLHFHENELILAELPPADDEAVNHPSHYGGADDPYEVIKVAEAWGFDQDAYLFNVLKYIARAGKKGATLQDHKKARFYLDRRIQRLEAGK